MIRKKQEWMPISRRSGEREKTIEEDEESDISSQFSKGKTKSQTKKKKQLQWCSVCGPTRKVKTRRFGSSPQLAVHFCTLC